MRFILLIFACMAISGLWGQTCQPSAIYYTHSDGEKDDASSGESAPLPAHFSANPADCDGWTARFEWTIAKQETPHEYILHRFDQDIDYTFTQSGLFVVTLKATFTLEGDTITYGDEGVGDDNTLVVNIQQSVLQFPNTITPNGDGYNDVLKAKEGYQSIVSFKATIVNRWGMKLYEWSDLDEGWDGRYNGSVVKDGVYYLVVEARGADGVHYNMRKAINVLTTSNKTNDE